MIFVYKVIFTILFFLFFPVLFLFPRIRGTIFKRLYIKKPEVDVRDCIWFHGASAGDILSIKPVIDVYLEKNKGDYNVLITSNTESGREIVKRYYAERVRFEYLPFDIPFSVSRFLRSFRPIILFVEASEFWPVIIHHAYKRGIKIVLINGNIKKERLFVYKLLSYISSNLFARYDLMIVRNEESRDSAIALGVDKERIIICTNTKYHSVFSMKSREIPSHVRDRFVNIKKLIVFGSIHYEEEEEILKAVQTLISGSDDIMIVIAPRHLERVTQIIKSLSSRGISSCKFSDNQSSSRVIILDTIGDLFYIYSFAYTAFVGGSICDLGGHNVLEPAIWGVPVITGKYMRNFEDIVKYLLGYGLVMVDSSDRLIDVILEILGDNEKRESLSALLLERVNALSNELSSFEAILKERFFCK